MRWLELEKGVISTEEEAAKRGRPCENPLNEDEKKDKVDQGVTEGGVNGAEQIKPSERKKDDELVSKGSVKISKRPRKVVVGCLNKDEVSEKLSPLLIIRVGLHSNLYIVLVYFRITLKNQSA